MVRSSSIAAHRVPVPPDPCWPRYSTKPFPSYRYLPGYTAHPRRHPDGHSFGQDEVRVYAFSKDRWAESEWYRYSVDLYNYAYWWECHEIFEAFWHEVGQGTEAGRLFRGLIQVAAGNLKRHLGTDRAAYNLYRSGMVRLAALPTPYLGIDLRRFVEEVEAYAERRTRLPALIRLIT